MGMVLAIRHAQWSGPGNFDLILDSYLKRTIWYKSRNKYTPYMHHFKITQWGGVVITHVFNYQWE